jgi:hypothetical protein
MHGRSLRILWRRPQGAQHLAETTSRQNEAAKIASASAQAAYDAYCRAMEDELNALYEGRAGRFQRVLQDHQ